MLGKLTKHEFLACGRVALPTYIAMLVLAAIGRFLTWLTSRQYLIDHVPTTFVKIIKVLSSLISTVYVIAFVALIVLTLVFLVYRFFKNFFTDEGYLMMTLPVRPVSLITSKLINAWVFIFFSAIIAIGSLYITLGHYDQLVDIIDRIFDSFKDVVNREGDFLREELGVPLWVFAVELVLFFFLLISRYVLSWYTSVGFGMLLSKKHKVLGTIIAYIILDVASYILIGIFLAVATSILPNYYEILASSGGKALQITVIGNSIINLLLGGLLFWFTSYIMKHKLNLD